MKLKILFLLVFTNVFSQVQMPIQVEETPYLLSKGTFQLENAFGFKKINISDKIILLPSTLIKYGLSNFLELRVTTEFQIDNLSNNYSFNPLIIGFKTKILKEKSWIPEMALVSQVAIPKLASKANELDRFAPELQIMMQGNYSDLFSMNYNSGVKWNGFDENLFYTYKFTSNFTFSQKWSCYSEIFGNYSSFQKPDTNINNGIMCLVNNDMFLDLSAGFGISEQSPSWFCAMIYSVRL